MEPVIVQAPLGDNPPQANLYYGLNVLDGLRLLPDESVSMVATSPPYWGFRDYGVDHQIWGGSQGCQHDWGEEIPQEKRHLYTSENCGKEKVVAEANNYPSTRGAFCQTCGAWKGHLGLEPTPHLYVEHQVEIFREVRRVLHPSGTLWLNLGDSYMSHQTKDVSQMGGFTGEKIRAHEGMESAVKAGRPSPVGIPGLKDKDLVGVPWRVALALQEDGWWLRNDIIWQKPNAMPSSVQDRLSCKYEHVFLLSKKPQYFFDLDSIKVPLVAAEGKKNPGDIWSIATKSYKGAHFAVWPPDLVRRMILAGSSKKGVCPQCKAPWKEGPTCSCSPHEPIRATVLDPFSGSATTGMVALQLRRDYVGLDLNADFLGLAEARILGRAPPSKTEPKKNPIAELFS